MNDSRKFYAGLSPFYHLIYPDWEGSMRRQAGHRDSVIREVWGPNGRSVLGASCGIGTQALGLAALGYDVTGSDLSREEVERAKKEAEERNLEIDFHVCDMRRVSDHFEKQFDLAREGDILLLKPLLLHASSPAREPKHQGVLHLVYYSGKPIQEPWHHSI